MTEKAVYAFIGKGVISDKFRERLNGRQISVKDIAAVDPDLDSQDIKAIVYALLNTPAGNFPGFSDEIRKYLDRRYRGGHPSGDNLPVSV